MTITLYTDVRLSPVLYGDAPNWKWKLLENSNHNNFLLGCSTECRNYRGMLQIENGSSYQIQTTITFYSDVWLSPVIYQDAQNLDPKLWENWIDNNFIHGCSVESWIYRDAPNWKRKLVGNSNDNNFLLGCPIESSNISRRSKLRLEAMSKLKWQ